MSFVAIAAEGEIGAAGTPSGLLDRAGDRAARPELPACGIIVAAAGGGAGVISCWLLLSSWTAAKE